MRVAQADINKARADVELSEGSLERTQKLHASGIASDAALERDDRIPVAQRLARVDGGWVVALTPYLHDWHTRMFTDA